MKLNELANVRSGLVLSRKESKSTVDSQTIYYKQINLKCITEKGNIDLDLLDDFYANEKLKFDYLTHTNDIIVRLSYPHTAVLITDEFEGFVIPSHFVIIKVNSNKLLPEYLYWLLNSEGIKKKIQQNNTGSILGTVKPSFFAELNLKPITINQQKLIADIYMTAKNEANLLEQLKQQKEILYKEITNTIYKNAKRGF